MRSVLLALGILGMAGGALMGLLVGSDVHADVAAMKAATQRGDGTAYNHAVDKFNADVHTRAIAFGIVIFGALFMAATAAYDLVEKRRASR